MEKQVLVVTKAFYKRAQVFNSHEFVELREAMAMFPAYSVVSPAQVAEKRTYKRLTIKQMEGYIKTQPDSEKRLVEFNAVQRVALAKGAKYPAAKKWFFENYPNFKNSGVCESETAQLLGKVVPMPSNENGAETASAEAAASNF